jgi:hypothetical protein
MKSNFVRFLVLVTLLVAASAPIVIAEGPVPQPMCVPGDVGCPK